VNLAHYRNIWNDHFFIEGQDCVTLAERYGTPLSLTSEDRVVEQFDAKAFGSSGAMEYPGWQQ
jgi:diaminopimelate decarboxylase